MSADGADVGNVHEKGLARLLLDPKRKVVSGRHGIVAKDGAHRARRREDPVTTGFGCLADLEFDPAKGPRFAGIQGYIGLLILFKVAVFDGDGLLAGEEIGNEKYPVSLELDSF